MRRRLTPAVARERERCARLADDAAHVFAVIGRKCADAWNAGGTEDERDHERICTARRIAVEDLAREIRAGCRPTQRQEASEAKRGGRRTR